MPRIHVLRVPLENVGAGLADFLDDLVLIRQCCQVDAGPHLRAALNIQIKSVQQVLLIGLGSVVPGRSAIANHQRRSRVRCPLDPGIPVKDRAYSLILALPDSQVHWSPLVIIEHVDPRSLPQQLVQNNVAILRILRENVHYQMNRAISILVPNVEVGALIYQNFNDVIVQARYAEMQRTPEDASAHIDVRPAVY